MKRPHPCRDVHRLLCVLTLCLLAKLRRPDLRTTVRTSSLDRTDRAFVAADSFVAHPLRHRWPGTLSSRLRTKTARFAGDSSSDLTEQTKLLRQQTEILVHELRLLREALSEDLLDEDDSEVPISEEVAAAENPPTAMPTAQPPQAQVSAAPAVTELYGPGASPSTPASNEPLPEAQPPQQSPVLETAAKQPVAPPSVARPSKPTPKPGKTKVKVVSAGHAHGNVADFYVDDVQVPIMLGAAGRRGLNVVIIDPNTGRVLSGRSYDIWGNARDENQRLAADLNALPEGHVVLVALKDSGMENIDSSSLAALRRFGAEIEGRLKEREAYALVGVKDGEALAERNSRERMLLVEATLPFAMQQKISPPPPSRPRAPTPPQPAPPPPQSVLPRQDAAPQPPESAPPPLQPATPRQDMPPTQPTVGNEQAPGADSPSASPPRSGGSKEEAGNVVDQIQQRIRAKRLAGLSNAPTPSQR
mmetsp:Transcript_129287/g.258155  ORF Transcript_129287/g.258155 Transcript_129287/m.258155 type:complete len:474 (+) Transcript_129287:161-1582(+)